MSCDTFLYVSALSPALFVHNGQVTQIHPDHIAWDSLPDSVRTSIMTAIDAKTEWRNVTEEFHSRETGYDVRPDKPHCLAFLSSSAGARTFVKVVRLPRNRADEHWMPYVAACRREIAFNEILPSHAPFPGLLGHGEVDGYLWLATHQVTGTTALSEKPARPTYRRMQRYLEVCRKTQAAMNGLDPDSIPEGSVTTLREFHRDVAGFENGLWESLAKSLPGERRYRELPAWVLDNFDDLVELERHHDSLLSPRSKDCVLVNPDIGPSNVILAEKAADDVCIDLAYLALGPAWIKPAQFVCVAFLGPDRDPRRRCVPADVNDIFASDPLFEGCHPDDLDAAITVLLALACWDMRRAPLSARGVQASNLVSGVVDLMEHRWELGRPAPALSPFPGHVSPGAHERNGWSANGQGVAGDVRR